jgi:hypothetical protein
MFKEDRHDDDNLVANEVDNGTTLVEDAGRHGAAVISGAAVAEILATNISNVLGLIEPQPAPKADGVKSLRDALLESEPWRNAYGGDDSKLSPGVRRLQERRVNRILTIVADWMLSVVERRQGDEMALVILLELAESIREQVIWPEREAAEAEVAQREMEQVQ